MNIADLLALFPRIRKVDPSQQEALFRIIDQAPLSSEALQISFERQPDFFHFVKAQGEVGHAFYFVNQDDSPQGFAVSTFRQMKWKNQSLCLGYTSDLRTTPKLDRVARMAWRNFYATAIEKAYEIEEFQKCSGFYTAVWNDNNVAQKALVQKKRAGDFSYQATTQYQSHALWGRLRPLFKPKARIRKIQENEIPQLLEILCESNTLSWQESDLCATLKVLDLSLEDFYVLEKNNKTQAFVLPGSTGKMKQTVIKKWPLSLHWASKLLPLFGKRPIHLHQPLEILQLMFFRSLNNNPNDLYDFADYFWYENNQKPKAQQFHLLTVGVWTSYHFQKRGYLVSSISGTLYKVIGDQVRPEFADIHDFSNLEVGLL